MRGHEAEVAGAKVRKPLDVELPAEGTTGQRQVHHPDARRGTSVPQGWSCRPWA
jgi:hypothetical protein